MCAVGQECARARRRCRLDLRRDLVCGNGRGRPLGWAGGRALFAGNLAARGQGRGQLRAVTLGREAPARSSCNDTRAHATWPRQEDLESEIFLWRRDIGRRRESDVPWPAITGT